MYKHSADDLHVVSYINTVGSLDCGRYFSNWKKSATFRSIRVVFQLKEMLSLKSS